MKKIFLGLAVFCVTFLLSCQKFDNEKPLTFDVSLDATTFKVGDPVTFKFKGGDANQISFYSGEVGNDYEYRNKNRIDQIKKVFFSFQTHNVPVGQVVYPDVMVSTDFNGIYDYDNVANKATWTPISHLFTWGANGPWQTMWTPSGNREITEYLEQGKPFYIAYRVKSDVYTATSAPSRNWRTNGHSLIAETIKGDYLSLANYAGMSWKLVDKYLAPTEMTQSSSVVSSSIMLLGYYNSSSPRYRQDAEVWGVSKKFESGEINLGSEGSVSLKQYIDLPLENYTHYYENPGVYKVVFLASNSTISSTTQVIKELEITITP